MPASTARGLRHQQRLQAQEPLPCWGGQLCRHLLSFQCGAGTHFWPKTTPCSTAVPDGHVWHKTTPCSTAAPDGQFWPKPTPCSTAVPDGHFRPKRTPCSTAALDGPLMIAPQFSMCHQHTLAAKAPVHPWRPNPCVYTVHLLKLKREITSCCTSCTVLHLYARACKFNRPEQREQSSCVGIHCALWGVLHFSAGIPGARLVVSYGTANTRCTCQQTVPRPCSQPSRGVCRPVAVAH
jgi:hypothetical protein